MRTIKDIRRSNLEYVINTRYSGIANRLAVDAGLHQAQIARVFLTGDSRRDIGDKLARKIEAGANLPEGWLDQEHAAADAILAKLSQLDVEQRKAVESLIDQLLR